jgi:hypothetical protein
MRAGLCALLLLLGLTAPAASEPAVARLLLDGAKADLAKRRFDDALGKLDKALVEDPALVEVHWWAGQVLEAKKEIPTAIERYRKVRSAVEARKSAGSASKEEATLLAKVTARLAALAPGEQEHRRMTDAYATQLLQLAKERLEEDPILAGRALRLLVGVRPAHDEANTLLARLGAAPSDTGARRDPPASRDEGPASRVRTWETLGTSTAFGSQTGWRYLKEHLAIDVDRGFCASERPGRPPWGPRFVYEAQVRWLEEKPGGFGIGLAFAGTGPRYHALFLLRDRFGFFATEGSGAPLDVAEHVAFEPLAPGEWHRIALVVDGHRIEGWLDGKKQVERASAERADWTGALGLWNRHGTFEVRGLRAGKLP